MSESHELDRHKAKKLSKLTKEKKRRDKINGGLKELANLLKEVRNLNEFQCASMEKAEILEAAVEYLKENRQATKQVAGFRSLGYYACANEITRYLATDSRIDNSTCKGLHNFLKDRCTKELPSHDSSTSSDISYTWNGTEAYLPFEPSTSTPLFNEMTLTEPLRIHHKIFVPSLESNGIIPQMPYKVFIPYPGAPSPFTPGYGQLIPSILL